MNVSHVMLTQERATIGPEQTLRLAWSRMDDLSVSGLAVIEAGAYAGVISRWEIALQAIAGQDLDQVEVRQAMIQPQPLKTGDPVDHAVEVLMHQRQRVLPVVDYDNRYAGLVTWEQVDHFVADILALDSQNPRLHLALMNAPGQLARLLRVLAESGANVLSLFISNPRVADLSHVVVKIDAAHAKGAVQALHAHGFSVID
jgi:CBS-domain-containing membrane protein